MNNTEELLKHLTLDKIGQNIFVGQNADVGSPNIYGGQVLAQSLSAAYETVESNRIAHSIHSYFLLPGDKTKPVEYRVENSRDGKSFTTRSVKAYQENREIYNAIVSFQIEEKDALEHQFKKPFMFRVPSVLFSWSQYAKILKGYIPKKGLDFLSIRRPVEFKVVEIERFIFRFIKYPPRKKLWFRFLKANSQIDQRKVQQLLLYSSDYYLLSTALDPHASTSTTKLIKGLKMASIDHAMWFHRKFDPTEWLLFDLDSPSATSSRGFTRGSIYTKSGTLVASVCQEGLIRLKSPENK